jgi:hypothetical protein
MPSFSLSGILFDPTMKLCLATIIGTCVGQDVFLASPSRTVSRADLVRAKSTEQNGRLGGSSPQEIADKINGHIDKLGLPTKQCSDYSLDELNQVIRDMFPHLNEDLNDIYGSATDLRTRRFATLAEYEKHWEEDAEHAVEIIRDAKCAEAVMLWAHHLSEGGKQAWSQKELPTVPTYDAEKASSENYQKAFNCVTGHNMQADHTSDHKWPHWPEDLHYTAKGHGAYPFWAGGGSDDGTADLEVWWSERLQSEKFYHSSCTDLAMGWVGTPCTHLLTGGQPNPKGYLYTDKKCCKTEPKGRQGQKLAASQSDFMDDFTYQGVVDFDGVHYKGKVKYYLMKLPVTQAVRDFWYFTDMNDMPVQQGEAGKGPTDQGYPVSIGHTIWHDYDQSSFDYDQIDSSIFEVPEICQSTSKMCDFP